MIYQKVARILVNQKKVVVLTGAGISVESGIPPFRGDHGVWTRYDPEEYGHISTFRNDPVKAWGLFKEMLDCTINAEPNEAHKVLAQMERKGIVNCIVTQNIDGLHQKAGSMDVVEFHGNNRFLVCHFCGKKYESTIYLERTPPLCECGQILKPDFILYGELIPLESMMKATEEVRRCKILLVIGTSNIVFPAADLTTLALNSGAIVIEVNISNTALTPYANYSLRGQASEILSLLMKQIEKYE